MVAFQGGDVSLTVLCFGLGIGLFYQLPELPDWRYWTGVLVLLLLIPLPCVRCLRAMTIGFAWAHLFTLLNAPAELPELDLPQTLTVSGRVESLVQRGPGVSRFLFLIETADIAGVRHTGRWRVRLSWHQAPQLRPGDGLRLTVRLKPAHGYATPGAWDYEGWLYHQQIRYTGYVREPEASGISASTCCAVARLRSRIGEALHAVEASAFARGVLRALVIGDRSALSADARRLFRDTGTSHLMAISGLHIGLVAGLGFVVFAVIWRRLPPLVARVPAAVAGATIGLGLSLAYATLAGFSLPTQRALIMLLVFAVAVWRRRDSRPSDVLASAAACVLLWNPASVIAAGFWLSFGAVAAILAVVALARKEPRWRTAVRTQLAISLSLWPILTLFGLPLTVAAPLVNLLLVPVFGLLIVPAALLGTAALMLAPDIGYLLLGWLGQLLDVLARILEYVTAQTGAWAFPLSAGWPDALIGTAAAAMLLAPRGFPFRWLALPLLIVAWLPRAPMLDDGEFNVHVLDVGQGLSIVVETHGRTLVYDTGPAYPSGFSAADAVLVPFLKTRQRRRIDHLVLSHGDNDHAGAVEQLLDAVEVGRVSSGEPQRIAVVARACRAGERWRWDGVDFEFLHPDETRTRHGNNASCVLRVDNGRTVVLLTGDIEAGTERHLVTEAAARLASDLIVAPHHGSATSSSPEFVGTVRPAYVVYTTGWANRYGFPDGEVERRWRSSGARALNTANAGAVSFTVDNESGLSPPRCQRVHARRFWWHVGGSADGCHPVSSAQLTDPAAPQPPISADFPDPNRPDWRNP